MQVGLRQFLKNGVNWEIVVYFIRMVLVLQLLSCYLIFFVKVLLLSCVLHRIDSIDKLSPVSGVDSRQVHEMIGTVLLEFL